MSNPQDADKFAYDRLTQEDIDTLRREETLGITNTPVIGSTESDEESEYVAADPEGSKVDESPNDASDQLEPRPASPDPPMSPPSAGAGGAAYIRRGMRVPATRRELRRRMLARGGEGAVLKQMEQMKGGQARRRRLRRRTDD